MKRQHLAIVASHPVQYYGPLFRALADVVDLEVLFAHRATPAEQSRAGFGVAFDWDVDITAGYRHRFLRNVSKRPGTNSFAGCDTPEIAEALSRGRFDAVLVTGWSLKSYVQAAIAAKRMGLPVLVRGDSQLGTPRSPLKRWLKAFAYPRLLRAFDAALYVGERSRAYYAAYRYPDSRLYFSPHCVDADRFAAQSGGEAGRRLRAQAGIGEAAEVVLFAGKLVPFKRPQDVLRAVARLRAQGRPVEAAFAGDGELRSGLTALAREQNVPCHFLGFRNQSEMPAVYAAGNVLALPSISEETWGLVANEALACGRPIVVSDGCGCAPDLVGAGGRNGVGRIFPVGDVEQFAQAIGGVLDAPPQREALERVNAAYSIARAVAGVLQALESVRAAG